MSLRPSFRNACQALALRSRPLALRQEPFAWTAPRRGYADESSQIPPLRKSKAASEVSKASAAANAQSSAGKQADANEAWSKIDAAAAREELASAARGQAGLKGGLTEAQEEALFRDGAIPPTPANGDPLRQLEILAQGGIVSDLEGASELDLQPAPVGHKFPLPNLPLPPQSHLKSRYHPVLDQVTNLMMRDGKKSLAQRNMAMVLNFLRTSPPPIINPRYPLLPGAPPAAHLPLNPVLYLTLAIDSVAPLVKIRRIAGGAGGGRPLELPAPLAVRQRRRAAFQWILDVVEKKPSKGSGRTQFAHRVAEEIIAVVEGRSPVWDKRLALHKLGTATRANLTVKPVKAH
ncbi:mitochondrial 37S ribosomal protein uS7m [Colletotrichum truncatum]|uniref:37S ribosomal protein S7, mitochondrial n=1 Tax=Colletotrichum truncatum TaxID=5467 RepID=A0ACC3YQU4_COLTU|nr:37S ribosomal protein S7, mitochondrial [Colletotrichum truncatum]KAF6799010.1 37S ribosomal protein S7, mitochondrial [Colletotrichum truncatum]